MAEASGFDSLDLVGDLGDEDDGKATVSDDSFVASLHRKYGLTMPTYSSNEHRAASSTNKGPYRSVLDFSSTEALTKAMLDTGEGHDTTASFDSFLQQIANGVPVQRVGAQKKNVPLPIILLGNYIVLIL